MSDFNLFDAIFLDERAARVAVLCEDGEITYSDLRAQTEAVAEALAGLGISPGDRVAILLNDSPEFIASFVAIISLGAIAVPINLALRTEEQRFILKDCGARCTIVEGDACATLFGSENQDVSPDLKDLLLVRSRENVPKVFPGLSVRHFSSATEAGPNGLAVDTATDTSKDAAAFILYTSGSTGEPKGAIHTQAHIDYTNRTFCHEVLKLREDDRLFSSSRLPFAYGLGNAFTFPLLNGLTTILCREKPSPEVVSRVFRTHRPTIFFGVPVVYRMLLDHNAKDNRLDCSSLRLCVSAGEALPAQLGEEWQRTFGIELLDGIGSTEMLHMFMSNHAGEVRYGSSGRLLNGYEARLLDHEGQAAAAGDEGNLWIRGGSAASGYWKRPETTAQTFADDWVRTGDLYRCDEDGYWWHMGRGDDCFKPTGRWVSPVEVEGVLLRHDRVGRAAVVEGLTDAGLSCVCAFIVVKSETENLETELRALCEKSLPRFKQPRRYIFVGELPYTATGKIQRFKLRASLKSQVPSSKSRPET